MKFPMSGGIFSSWLYLLIIVLFYALFDCFAFAAAGGGGGRANDAGSEAEKESPHDSNRLEWGADDLDDPDKPLDSVENSDRFEISQEDHTRRRTPDGAVWKYKVRVISDIHAGSEWFNKDSGDALENMLTAMCENENEHHGDFTHLIFAGNILNFMAIPPHEHPPEPHLLIQTMFLGREVGKTHIASKPGESDSRTKWLKKRSGAETFVARNLLRLKWWESAPKGGEGVAKLGEGLRSVLREGIEVIWLPGNAERGLSDEWVQNELHNQLHLARDARLKVLDTKPYFENWGLRVSAGQETDLFAARDPRNRRPFSYYIDRVMAKHSSHKLSQRDISRRVFRESYASLRMSVPLGTPQLAKPKNFRKLMLEALRLANGGTHVEYDEVVRGGHWHVTLDEQGMFTVPGNLTDADVSVDEILEEYQNLLEDWISTYGVKVTESTIRSTAYDDYSLIPGLMSEADGAEVVVFGHTLEDGQANLGNGLYAVQTGGWTSGVGGTRTYVDIYVGYTTTGYMRPLRVDSFHFGQPEPKPLGIPWTRGLKRLSNLGITAILTTSVIVLIFIVLIVVLIAYCIKLLCPMSNLSKEDLDFIKCRRQMQPVESPNDFDKSSSTRNSLRRATLEEKLRQEQVKKEGSTGGSVRSADADDRRPTITGDVGDDNVDDSASTGSRLVSVDHRSSIPLLSELSRSVGSRSFGSRGAGGVSVAPHLRDFDEIVNHIETNYADLPRKKISQLINHEYKLFHREHDLADYEKVERRRLTQELEESIAAEQPELGRRASATDNTLFTLVRDGDV